jgi:hypothetical protein
MFQITDECAFGVESFVLIQTSTDILMSFSEQKINEILANISPQRSVEGKK